MKVVAFVPIRLHSSRVPGKNSRRLGDKPLMCHILNTLVQVDGIDEVYVFCSTTEVKPWLPQGVHLVQRSTELDSDQTTGKEIYDAFVKAVNADYYLLAHATSPFLKAETLARSVAAVKSGAYDSAFSVQKLQTFAWYDGAPLNYSLASVPRTQQLKAVEVETSGFYLFSRELWTSHHRRIGFRPYHAEVDRVEGLDIDWPEDFEFAELVTKTMSLP